MTRSSLLAHIGSVAMMLVAITSGCNRAFYRNQADEDAYRLVNEKTNQQRWPLANYTIEVDPQSRMFDPYNPDRPPMPPDDKVAHQYMHEIDGMRAYPHWEANGYTNSVENPDWLAFLPVNENGRVVLNADTSVQLARLHSPEFQEQLEELYLSALDVSFERFRFDHQFFGGHSAIFTTDGRDRFVTGGDSSSELEVSTASPGGHDYQLRKLYGAGAELVVGMANSLVWQFSGPDMNNTNTLLDFSLVQPLLRFGGRDVVLERLTIAERSLLANVRQMERFRRGFYLEIVTGQDAGPGPSRRGGFFGGAGLEGFSGVGGGGFGRVGGGFSTGFGGFGGTTGAGAGEAGGFLGLLQEEQSIRNQTANIAALRNSLAQLEAFFESGRIDFFQVVLARQALFNAQSVLLNSQTAYSNSLDRFKRDMGLPPGIELQVDNSLVSPFNLVDTAIVPIQNRLTELQSNVGDTIISMLGSSGATPQANNQLDNGGNSGIANWSDSIAGGLQRLRQLAVAAHQTNQEILSTNLRRATRDVERLEAFMDQRRESLVDLRQALLRRFEASGNVEGAEAASLGVLDVTKLERLPGQLRGTLEELTGRFTERAQSLDQLIQRIDALLAQGSTLEPDVLAQRIRTEIFSPIPNQLTLLSSDVLELLLVQARARTESIVLVPVEMTPKDALRMARANRLDWMNARANLVDTWRLVQFNADDLESQLDLTFSGDISNQGDNPLDLRGSKGRLRVGVEFDAPLTRLSERNIYRESLIEYQQARREYYEFEDFVARSLRSTIREIELNRLNFELRREAVQVAIAQVESAQLRLQEPPRPNEEAVFGATTARDLVDALAILLNTQNDFLSVWISYEVLRRSLDFNLGTMQLTPDGRWIDPGPVRPTSPNHDIPFPRHSGFDGFQHRELRRLPIPDRTATGA